MRGEGGEGRKKRLVQYLEEGPGPQAAWVYVRRDIGPVALNVTLKHGAARLPGEHHTPLTKGKRGREKKNPLPFYRGPLLIF